MQEHSETGTGIGIPLGQRLDRIREAAMRRQSRARPSLWDEDEHDEPAPVEEPEHAEPRDVVAFDDEFQPRPRPRAVEE